MEQSMRTCLTLVPLLLVTCGPASAIADETRVLAAIRAFFATQDLDRRAELAAQIESDSAYRRDKLSGWLHDAIEFDKLEAGQSEIHVPLANGQSRRVVLRIPAEYDASKPWPLIYALHGKGGRGEGVIRYFEHVLGSDVEQYLIAAPSRYEEAVIHRAWPPPMEHPRALAALRRAVHVDSDRVFVAGYSLGGHATWTLAVLHSDQFAGALAVAGTFSLLEVDKLWGVFLPNLANTHMVCVWGVRDMYANDGNTLSPEGGIAGLNRRLCELAESSKLPVVGYEDPERGHGDVVPPGQLVKELLGRRRVQYPARVRQTFRHIYQAQAYWLEGHVWKGPQWTEKLPTVRLRQGEDANRPDDVTRALVRTIRGVLGELRGTVDGQTIDVRRTRVSELTIWIGDGMLDWDKPVTVKVSARKVFEGVLEPDLFVCLAQAARTYDFDRLRWAGLRFRSGHKARLVTGRTTFRALGEQE